MGNPKIKEAVGDVKGGVELLEPKRFFQCLISGSNGIHRYRKKPHQIEIFSFDHLSIVNTRYKNPEGESIKLDQPLTSNPNVGGFGQGDAEIVLQDPLRIHGLLFFLASVILAQIFLVLKKKQFEKVQLYEINF
ncbi:Cytochrome f protein [Dioscorea alata]|uniref:Cytochrome f protein n=1 Tax=Dioscorea alata TaxID=55571 RepID=A0ACB7VQZ9_DIOAL|nr:Cytochrome f protein [Dioscorea alata]